MARGSSRAGALAYVALGSNLGDRPRSLHRALTKLRRIGHLERTASLYESEAALVAGPRYLNTVCALRTELSPQELLVALKTAEVEIGRVPGPRFGPRAIDLDIILYEEEVVHDKIVAGLIPLPLGAEAGADLDLEIPHPRMAERSFVLEPLAEIAPSAHHPTLNRTAAELSAQLGAPALTRVTPLGALGLERSAPPASAAAVAAADTRQEGPLMRWGLRTQMMGVLNVTPDSFSDGGRYEAKEAALEHAWAMARAGADLIDVGAQSTRPGMTPVPPEEEVRRASPVIKALVEGGLPVPISLDTNSAAVAEALVPLGVSLVNDISGGLHDARMLPTLAQLGVPAVLMHTRGGLTEMHSATPRYEDVVGEVRAELGLRLDAAFAAGLPRWALLADPGIGFAKSASHNLRLLRELHRLSGEGGLGVPLLLGVSRKAFVGKALGGAPSHERLWGTAGACAACVPHADVLRVHDVAEMRQAVAVVDAIRRDATLAQWENDTQ